MSISMSFQVQGIEMNLLRRRFSLALPSAPDPTLKPRKLKECLKKKTSIKYKISTKVENGATTLKILLDHRISFGTVLNFFFRNWLLPLLYHPLISFKINKLFLRLL